MGNTRDLSNRINESYSRLSKGQKLLATYITDNYDKAVFLTAARLGEVVGVSESTVVRFATHLGYKGYPEFQNALEELVRNKLNSIQRMEVTYGRISQSKILAYRSLTLVTARFSESSESSYNNVRPSVRANVSAPASERVRIS